MSTINTQVQIVSKSKKSHTCEKEAEHLRIYFWHLLMNLKKKLLKKTVEVGQ